jgi:hypothetical protein
MMKQRGWGQSFFTNRLSLKNMLRGERVAKQLCHPITVDLKTLVFRCETVVTVALEKT